MECTHQTQAVHIPPKLLLLATRHQPLHRWDPDVAVHVFETPKAVCFVVLLVLRGGPGPYGPCENPWSMPKIPADRIDSYQVRVCTPPIQRIVVGCCWQSSHVFPCRRWISSCNIKQRSLCFRSLCFHYEDPLYTGFTTVQRFNSVLPVNTFTPKVM